MSLTRQAIRDTVVASVGFGEDNTLEIVYFRSEENKKSPHAHQRSFPITDDEMEELQDYFENLIDNHEIKLRNPPDRLIGGRGQLVKEEWNDPQE